MKVTLIGIDLAKSIFQVCGVNQAGNSIFNRQVRRARLMELLMQHPDATIAMEACSGSNYWGRDLQQRGFKVKLIPPQHVKPFVKGNKNDRNDAFAITEAARRPDLKCVEPRTLAQTDMIQVHRVLNRVIRQRTALINQIRGFLSEYGVVVARGKDNLFAAIPDLLEDAENGLTPSSRMLFQSMYDEWRQMNEAVNRVEQELEVRAKADEPAQRLMAMKGVGVKISTAMIAQVGNGHGYKNGRHCSANLGLIQHHEPANFN